MTVEGRNLGFRFKVFTDNLSTKWSDVEFTPFGRHRIHPRGGRLIVLQTPQGRRMDIGERDILHLTQEGKVVARFTPQNLPEGYQIIKPMKGER